MKKAILTLTTCAIATLSFAQINKDAWLTGASSTLGYNSYSYSSKSGSDLIIFNMNLKGGYFIANNLLLGINLAYFGSSTSSSGSSGSSSSYTLTSIGIFSRYYLPKNIFIGVGINSTSSSSTNGSFTGSNSNSSRSTTFPLELGVAAFISKSFALEPSLNYIKADDSVGLIYNGAASVAGVTSSIGINLGLTFYLNRN